MQSIVSSKIIVYTTSYTQKKMTINIGDTVRFLREKGGGTVSGFRPGGLILVEDQDGFEIPMHEADLVVIPNSKTASPQEQVSCKFQQTPQSSQDQTTEFAKLEERVLQLERLVQRLSRKLEELEAADTLRRHARMPLNEDSANNKPRNISKDEIIEIDLHAHALLDSTDGLSPSEIKEYQMRLFRETMETFSKDKGRRIVFIHGNGDGVLRKSILTELKYSYKSCRYQDASFQQYGFGATMVTIG